MKISKTLIAVHNTNAPSAGALGLGGLDGRRIDSGAAPALRVTTIFFDDLSLGVSNSVITASVFGI